MLTRRACILFAALLILALSPGCELSVAAAPHSAQPQVATPSGGALSVWFLDVGQADAVLLYDGTAAVLVDAGNNGDGEAVVEAIRERGIERLALAVGTHPHEDHIGGLDAVLLAIATDAVLLPDIEADTKTYRDVLDAIEETGAQRLFPKAGDDLQVGAFLLEVLGPVKEYDNLNDASVVLRAVYGDTAFLLTGDVEATAEKDILSMGYDLSCDVLKAPHHGSETSSSYLFLRQSNPSSVVISCGEGNSYGHPHEGPLSRYRDLGATIYRTDLLGTVAMTSDGKTVTADARGIESDAPHSQGAQDGLVQGGEIVLEAFIGNKNSKKFHVPTCSGLPAEQNRVSFVSRGEAVQAGYAPCGICKP